MFKGKNSGLLQNGKAQPDCRQFVQKLLLVGGVSQKQVKLPPGFKKMFQGLAKIPLAHFVLFGGKKPRKVVFQDPRSVRIKFHKTTKTGAAGKGFNPQSSRPSKQIQHIGAFEIRRQKIEKSLLGAA